MLASITFIKALVSPGLIPLLLSFVVAAIDYYFQTRPDNQKNQRSRARWMFLLTGVLGTILSIYLYAKEATATEDAEAKAAAASTARDKTETDLKASMAKQDATQAELLAASTNQAKTEAALLVAVEALETHLTNSTPTVPSVAESGVTSNRLAFIEWTLASVQKSGTPQNQATNALIRAKIENVSAMMRFNEERMR